MHPGWPRFQRNDLSQRARQSRLTSSRMPKHSCLRTHSPWIKPRTKVKFQTSPDIGGFAGNIHH